MANIVYNEYKQNLITGSAAFTPGTSGFGVMLVTSAYSAEEGHTFADVASGEVNTLTYPTYSRQLLEGVTISKVEVGGDATGKDDYYKVDADDTTFGPNSTITAAGAIIFQKNIDETLTSDPQSIVTFVDFSGSKSSSNGDFTVVWNANGILNYQQGT